jgi:2-octaprenyl-6-methoxyphenol hydroxylase
MSEEKRLNDFDIAICGAGPVGLALAAMLAADGMRAERIALVDGKTVEQALRDPRSIALSYGSAQILEKIGAWPIEANPIHQIHVSRRGHFGRTLIEREDYGVAALGYVTRYGKVVEALARQTDQAGIASLRPLTVGSIDETDESVTLSLSDQRSISADILVQAEGGVFNEQGAKPLHRDYGQTAIIGLVHVSAPLPQRAFERFTDEGPLALLPQDDGYALVWCVRPDRATQLLALDDTAFLHELGQAFGTRLGRFVRSNPRLAFPLGLNADPAATRRTVAIGNAAQTLHPVAGQGLNLGLRDAAVLARQLAGKAGPDLLEAFKQSRQTDRSTTIRLTDMMARAFASAPTGALSQTVLGLSLGLVDALKPAKQFLAEQMMFGSRP